MLNPESAKQGQRDGLYIRGCYGLNIYPEFQCWKLNPSKSYVNGTWEVALWEVSES